MLRVWRGLRVSSFPLISKDLNPPKLEVSSSKLGGSNYYSLKKLFFTFFIILICLLVRIRNSLKIPTQLNPRERKRERGHRSCRFTTVHNWRTALSWLFGAIKIYHSCWWVLWVNFMEAHESVGKIKINFMEKHESSEEIGIEEDKAKMDDEEKRWKQLRWKSHNVGSNYLLFFKKYYFSFF